MANEVIDIGNDFMVERDQMTTVPWIIVPMIPGPSTIVLMIPGPSTIVLMIPGSLTIVPMRLGLLAT